MKRYQFLYYFFIIFFFFTDKQLYSVETKINYFIQIILSLQYFLFVCFFFQLVIESFWHWQTHSFNLFLLILIYRLIKLLIRLHYSLFSLLVTFSFDSDGE